MNCFFGEIVDKKMVLNDIGKIALENWLNIPDHFKNAVLHEHVVIPNHIHGIVVLQTPSGVGRDAVGASYMMPAIDNTGTGVGPQYMVAGYTNSKDVWTGLQPATSALLVKKATIKKSNKELIIP